MSGQVLICPHDVFFFRPSQMQIAEKKIINNCDASKKSKILHLYPKRFVSYNQTELWLKNVRRSLCERWFIDLTQVREKKPVLSRAGHSHSNQTSIRPEGNFLE